MRAAIALGVKPCSSEGDQDSVQNPQVNRPGLATENLNEHHLREAAFAQQVMNQILIAIVHAGQRVSVKVRLSVCLARQAPLNVAGVEGSNA